jgi:predicted secreted protein
MLKQSHGQRIGLLLATSALIWPAYAAASSSGTPCSSTTSARTTPACAITTPARHKGTIASAHQHDYYVLHAQRHTRLKLVITDTENFGCMQSMFTTCGSVRASLVSASGRQLASTPATVVAAGGPAQATLSHTLTRAGTYYVVVTGTLGTTTPPPTGAPTTHNPVPYTLKVTASPNAHWPPAVNVAVPARGGFVRKSVSQEPGGLIVIKLQNNNPSTGFGWSYTVRPARPVVLRVSDHTAPERSGLVGARQTRTIIYRAVAKGTTQLRLLYLPPTGSGTTPDASLTLRITVP